MGKRKTSDHKVQTLQIHLDSGKILVTSKIMENLFSKFEKNKTFIFTQEVFISESSISESSGMMGGVFSEYQINVIGRGPIKINEKKKKRSNSPDECDATESDLY